MSEAAHRYLTVNGELGGTGLRDSYEGDELLALEIGVSTDLANKIGQWVSAYGSQHRSGFPDLEPIEELDKEGISIAKALMDELPNTKVTYYSHGLAKSIWF